MSPAPKPDAPSGYQVAETTASPTAACEPMPEAMEIEEDTSSSPQSAETKQPALGPAVMKVQFRWAVETFLRTDRMEHGRFVYRSRGSLDGKGGLQLSYQKKPDLPDGFEGAWEISSSAGKCLYRLACDGDTPTALVGSRPWARSYGGECNIVVMQSTQEDVVGWVEGGLAAETLSEYS
eukprot:TRINITY_DN95350_c0_g1_i1.p1 TRINITY_DN95350_c0_g1~~TRINITY_DN95350_c0_g1_i1.p1  ORF type:complete len:179 (+),score=25.58 TRINITY_DN95350_c0_g1_i1:38-574(+)